MTESAALPHPMSSAIAFTEEGTPYLTGQKCGACGEVMPGTRIACSRCFATGSLSPHPLGATGEIFAWTIVHRSFPGVAVPLVSAAVRLESGAFLKGNVEGLEPSPEAVAACGAVAVDFDELDAPDGSRLVRYFFRPYQEAHHA